VLKDGALLMFDYDVEIGLDSVSDALLRTIYYLIALRSSVNYAKYHGLERRMIVMLEEPAAHVFPFFLEILAEQIKDTARTVKVVINTHNPLLVSAIWDRVSKVGTYYVYRDSLGSTSVAEIDIEKVAKSVADSEDLMLMRVNDVVTRFVKIPKEPG